MNNATDKELDKIYKVVDVLMKNDCWEFLDEFFANFVQRVWRTDVDELLAYATASLPGKNKIPSRERFVDCCKKLFPDEDLWKGLE